jgi:hypothetical protein
MTHDDVALLCEEAPVKMPRYQMSGIRGRVTQVTDNFIRIDWADSRHSYDILRRTSPLWSVIELDMGALLR